MTAQCNALLTPKSVAIVGASPKPGSFGNDVVQVLRSGGYEGAVYPVNPNYESIEDLKCYPKVGALPEAPDLVVLAVAGVRVEAAFDEAIAGGAKAITIFDSCYIEDDTKPLLLDRLKAKARAAGIAVCGGNGMGFYNFDAKTHVSFQHAPVRPAGNIALIAHSGSVFVSLVGNDPRYRFNLVVSAGQEIGTTVSDYMEFALSLPSTRVIALFIETIRDPQGFIAALEKARGRDIPVVVTKVGRTEESARLAATHCGALAGNDAAYDALFERYGVVRVDSLDELMAAAFLLSQPKRAAKGGLGAVTDSGGLRELLIDMADLHRVPFAKLKKETIEKLRQYLPHGLEAANPLDAAGPLKPDYADVFKNCLQAIMDDPNTALGAFEFEVRDEFVYMPALLDASEQIAATSGKPLVLYNSFSPAQNTRIALRLLDAGIPMINGASAALVAIRAALAYRDGKEATIAPAAIRPESRIVARWKERLAGGEEMDEAESLALLRDFGISTAHGRVAESREAAIDHASTIGFPVALKTAAPDIRHKSDVDGVRLGLNDAAAVAAAYADIAGRLGPRVVIEPMVKPGVELAFGMTRDDGFGPIVMVGSGGKWIEYLKDSTFSMPDFDENHARRLIDRLKIRPLLDGARDLPKSNMDALAKALSKFSVLVAELGDFISEIDVNPIIAGPTDAIAVDAVIVPQRKHR